MGCLRRLLQGAGSSPLVFGLRSSLRPEDFRLTSASGDVVKHRGRHVLELIIQTRQHPQQHTCLAQQALPRDPSTAETVRILLSVYGVQEITNSTPRGTAQPYASQPFVSRKTWDVSGKEQKPRGVSGHVSLDRSTGISSADSIGQGTQDAGRRDGVIRPGSILGFGMDVPGMA